MPRVGEISINSSVAVFALVLSVACGVLCGLAPAFAAMKTDLTESLKQGDRTSTGSASHTWLRSALVVSEIAIALMLLTVSGAFLRSFQKMQAVDPGFRADHLLVAGYQLPLSQYPTNGMADNFNRELVRRLSSKPGITAAGMTNSLPATGFPGRAAYTIEGERAENWKLHFAAFANTDGDYFKAMSIRLKEGRYFTDEDRWNKPLVVIMNESMAKHSWPNESAIGKRMHVGNPHKGLPWATVVGVVADTKTGSRDEPSGDQWYSPMQQPALLFGDAAGGNLPGPAGGVITMRSTLPPKQMEQTLRATVAEIDPLLALQQVQPMDEVVAQIEAPRKFNTNLIAAFAMAALLLAITGIYAVVAFSVSLRTQEIAIRMALGAQKKGIAQLVLVSGAKLALIGCALGVLASLAVSRLVTTFLFEVSATDPLIYLGGVVLMMLMALLASMLPATRAASVEPVVALRST
jgi:putative ABC transport system permease protein